MKNSLNLLVSNFYTEDQADQVKTILATDEGYLLNYKILAIAVQEETKHLSLSQVMKFYETETPAYFTEVDYVIANLVTTLAKLTGKNIAEGYEKALFLDNTEPEFEYLLDEVLQYLSNK